MIPPDTQIVDEAFRIWRSGGWLMVPLLALTLYMYANALDLWLRVHGHFLLRLRTHRRTANEIARDPEMADARRLVRFEALSALEVRRHFEEVRNEYLPPIDRRLRYLGVIVSAGPLLGLLGTVTGMLSTFSGMVANVGGRFESIVTGVSEALITTQTGLVISVPAMVILSLAAQRRRKLEHAIARLERFNTRLALRADCPVPRRAPGRPNRAAAAQLRARRAP